MCNSINKYSLYIFLIVLTNTSSLYANDKFIGEFFLFPFVESQHSSNVDTSSHHNKDEYDFGVDIFTTFDYGNFLFLGEFLLSKEDKHFERLHIGYEFSPTNRVWFGRFHNPIGFWNGYFHHGDYLETSISRPAIEEFEDHRAGILAMHLTGFLYEGALSRGESALGYSLAVATGPEFDDGLNPLDVTDPEKGKRDISTTLNIYYEPVMHDLNKYGLFINYNEIPATDIGVDEIHQLASGVYLQWRKDRWTVLSTFYHVYNDLTGPANTTDSSFMHAYLQTDYEYNDKLTFFARIEETFSDSNDVYLNLYHDFVRDKTLAGIRLDILEQNALKLEISNNQTRMDDFTQIRLQWSAYF